MMIMTNRFSDIVIELMVLDVSNIMRGRTRLQKTMFLLKYKYKVPLGLKFEPYFYGPYSEDLAYDIEMLKALGVIEEQIVRVNDYIEYQYKLTDKGKEILSRLLEKDQQLKQFHEKISEYVKELNEIPLRDLISEAKSLITASSL